MNKLLTEMLGIQNFFVFHKISIINYIKDAEQKNGFGHV